MTAPPEPEAPQPILEVRFFRTTAGNEPVREWLRSLTREDRRRIGEDIKTAQFGWPIGMLLIRKLEKSLWEVRTTLEDGIARIIFTVLGDRMILLHGFIKKFQKTPKNDLEAARKRLRQLEDE
ncbi:type II toxin-antitoxin system RelE/ParE family toxin [Deinococcus sp. YIM 134068]|uniref:type II toxin-antitoxin system RelE/ParE family toxin n=1 Tax=Deinococcus lichenicola TaxID=3118910 RepID=UPI002F95C86E